MNEKIPIFPIGNVSSKFEFQSSRVSDIHPFEYMRGKKEFKYYVIANGRVEGEFVKYRNAKKFSKKVENSEVISVNQYKPFSKNENEEEYTTLTKNNGRDKIIDAFCINCKFYLSKYDKCTYPTNINYSEKWTYLKRIPIHKQPPKIKNIDNKCSDFKERTFIYFVLRYIVKKIKDFWYQISK